MNAVPDITPSDQLRTVGNGGNGGFSALERRLDRMESRIGERLTKLEDRLGELEKTTNTMKGTVDTWKWIVPIAVLVAGVIGALVATIARMAVS